MSDLQKTQNQADFPQSSKSKSQPAAADAILRPVLAEATTRIPSQLRGSKYPRLSTYTHHSSSPEQTNSLAQFQWCDLQNRCPALPIDLSQRFEKHFSEEYHNVLELSLQSRTIFPISRELAAKHGKYFKKIQESSYPPELTARAQTRNRYRNVIPNEFYRVPLISVRGYDSSTKAPIYSQPHEFTEGRLRADDDYINASDILPLKGLPGCKQTYIACQAPTQATIDDMWEMIWQQHVELVVFLTKFVEEEAGPTKNIRPKSIPYWPTRAAQPTVDATQAAFMSPGRPTTSGVSSLDMSKYEHLNYEEPPAGATNTFGQVKVTVEEIDQLTSSEVAVRRFKIQNLTDLQDPKGEKPENQRTVSMLHFTGWPDFDLPEAEQMFRVFTVYNILRTKMVIPQSPIVVHCSAGIGRTGTFIAIDMMLDYIRNQQQARFPIDIRNVVKIVAGLRTCRPGMVQTDSQYSFIYYFLQYVYGHPRRTSIGLQ